ADIVQLLLEKGAVADRVDDRNNLPLHLAAQNGHADVVGLLLTRDISMDATVGNSAINALTLATQNGHKNVVELLVSKGADITHRGDKGESLLYSAAANNNPELVRFYHAKGLDLEDRG